jgi:hypothetical protein
MYWLSPPRRCFLGGANESSQHQATPTSPGQHGGPGSSGIKERSFCLRACHVQRGIRDTSPGAWSPRDENWGLRRTWRRVVRLFNSRQWLSYIARGMVLRGWNQASGRNGGAFGAKTKVCLPSAILIDLSWLDSGGKELELRCRSLAQFAQVNGEANHVLLNLTMLTSCRNNFFRCHLLLLLCDRGKLTLSAIHLCEESFLKASMENLCAVLLACKSQPSFKEIC